MGFTDAAGKEIQIDDIVVTAVGRADNLRVGKVVDIKLNRLSLVWLVSPKEKDSPRFKYRTNRSSLDHASMRFLKIEKPVDYELPEW